MHLQDLGVVEMVHLDPTSTGRKCSQIHLQWLIGLSEFLIDALGAHHHIEILYLPVHSSSYRLKFGLVT